MHGAENWMQGDFPHQCVADLPTRTSSQGPILKFSEILQAICLLNIDILEISHGGVIYTAKLSKCPNPGLPGAHLIHQPIVTSECQY